MVTAPTAWELVGVGDPLGLGIGEGEPGIGETLAIGVGDETGNVKTALVGEGNSGLDQHLGSGEFGRIQCGGAFGAVGSSAHDDVKSNKTIPVRAELNFIANPLANVVL